MPYDNLFLKWRIKRAKDKVRRLEYNPSAYFCVNGWLFMWEKDRRKFDKERVKLARLIRKLNDR